MNNVGTTDRIIRIAIGVALLSLFVVAPGQAKWLGLLAIIPLATAVVGTCPIYSMLGIRTCRTR